MLHQLRKFSHSHPFVLACSGGVDSMAVADFYCRGGKNFSLAYFDHKTGNRENALPIIEEFAKNNGLWVHVGNLTKEKPKDLSLEEHWRNERYNFLSSLKLDIVTCHHLNDAAEGFLFSALHGKPRVMSSRLCGFAQNGEALNVYRPFLSTTKQELIDWCLNHSVSWFEDTSNQDVKYPRNRIRHNIMPEAFQINPGFLKVIKKKILDAEGLV